MTKILHPKIKELQLRAAPINYSGKYVNAVGVPETRDRKTKASATGREVEGYLAVWGVKDTYGTVMVKGCCSKSIQERGPKSSTNQKIAHLWQHQIDNPTGQFIVLKEDDYGLYFKADLDEIPVGDRELTQVRSGTLNQFSIGFNYIWERVEYDEKTESIVLLEIELMEGSVVTFGSNDQTHAIRSIEQLNDRKAELMDETEDFIRSIPRKQQLELRALISKHSSLAAITPETIAKLSLDTRSTPTQDVAPKIDYAGLTKLLSTKNIFES